MQDRGLEQFPRPALRYQHVQAFKQALAEQVYALASINLYLVNLNGILREA